LLFRVLRKPQQGAGSWRTNFVGSGSLSDATDTIYTAVQPDGISNVTAYLVSHLTTTLKAGLHTTTSGCASALSTNESTISACYATAGASSGKLTVVKYVGIASSDAFPGTELETASHAVSHAASVGYNAILSEHTKAWAKIWDSADIIIPGEENEQLQLATRASLFHLLSNVREGSEGHGLGDNSIAPAGLTSDSYAGQIFWDADTWMAPSLLALFPSYAEVRHHISYILGTCECLLIPNHRVLRISDIDSLGPLRRTLCCIIAPERFILGPQHVSEIAQVLAREYSVHLLS
jgi:hypothetical protein